MPELPEVETTRLGVLPHLRGRAVLSVIVRRGDLRLPVDPGLEGLVGCRFIGVRRRSKYLLADVEGGRTLLIHLGMSGSLRVVPEADEWRKHDHVGLSLDTGRQLRYHDPRRFGMILVHETAMEVGHSLLQHLGPEPLEEEFSGVYLHSVVRRRRCPIKQAIMDATVVVGVGNIYASEALFRAGIRPVTQAVRVSRARCDLLVGSIKEVLAEAISQGGTTLRDFLRSDGEPGYFRQRLMVYGRGGEPCRVCGEPIRQRVLGGRSTFWCRVCQS